MPASRVGEFVRSNMRTLVLNAGYEPLAVVSFKRALILVLNEKATVLAGISGAVVRSASSEFDMPSVILLSRYVRIPNARRVPVSRRGVLREMVISAPTAPEAPTPSITSFLNLVAVRTPGRTWWPAAFLAITKKAIAHRKKWAGN